MQYETPDSFDMSKTCKHCGSSRGTPNMDGVHERVNCAKCGRYVYFRGKVESGRKKRSVSTVHDGLRTSTKAKVKLRSNGMCELCGKSFSESPCHVSHVISVNAGLAHGLTETELNDAENLVALCEECNIGLSDTTLPVRFVARVLRCRVLSPESATV